MTKKIKYKIAVRVKAERYGEQGELIETIMRTPWFEPMGNFTPMFCRYQGKKMLVLSEKGDLSDPFRRTKDYLDCLYIEIVPLQGIALAASMLGTAGGRARSERKTTAARLNGLKGGRPKGKAPDIHFPTEGGEACSTK